MALILGIDDAGRGPIIGPMILAGVLIEKAKEPQLKKHGVTDSKLLPHQKRIALSKILKELAESFKIVKASPEEIDLSLKSKINLNTLEAIKTAEIINFLAPKKQRVKVIIDCPSTNTSAWKNTLLKYLKTPQNLTILCEHKADFNHISVAAASILAKVEREEEVQKIKKQYGDIGSGYPSDPTTKLFLKTNGALLANKGIFRKSWATWKALFPEKSQSTLENY